MNQTKRISWTYIAGLLILFVGLIALNTSASSQATAVTATPTNAGKIGTNTDVAATNTEVASTPTTQPTLAVTATPTPAATKPPSSLTLIPPPAEPISQTLRSVSVSGSGSVDAQPDMAVLVIGVRTEDKDAAKALTENNSQMETLMTALRSAGVTAADIRTLTIQLSPRYPQSSSGASDAKPTDGFVAENSVEVTVRDLDNMGQLIDQAVQAGGNQIQGIRFQLSDSTAMLNQAREAAVKDALQKAQQLANLTGTRLGVVLTINESSVVPRPYMRDLAQASMGGSVPVSPGTMTINVDVQITWELQ